MHSVDQRLAALRRDINLLKAARQMTVDANRQHQIYVRLSACILESIQLIETRLQAYAPQQPVEQAKVAPQNPR
jgi:hypothetical protein